MKFLEGQVVLLAGPWIMVGQMLHYDSAFCKQYNQSPHDILLE